VPIDGKPLLSRWLEICESHGIEEVLINTHYLADCVRAWAEKCRPAVKITLAHEEKLLGSAGTVAANRAFVDDVEDFFVFYADNLVDVNLDVLKAFHIQRPGPLTLGLFRSPNPKSCGIVTLDAAGCVTSFEEKPANPKSDLAYAGILIARRAIFNLLPNSEYADFGSDVLPRLCGKIFGLLLDGYIRDIGTPESYTKAQEDWRLRRKRT
jgi:mannose-1-phosphate guanylyltransferase